MAGNPPTPDVAAAWAQSAPPSSRPASIGGFLFGPAQRPASGTDACAAAHRCLCFSTRARTAAPPTGMDAGSSPSSCRDPLLASFCTGQHRPEWNTLAPEGSRRWDEYEEPFRRFRWKIFSARLHQVSLAAAATLHLIHSPALLRALLGRVCMYTFILPGQFLLSPTLDNANSHCLHLLGDLPHPLFPPFSHPFPWPLESPTPPRPYLCVFAKGLMSAATSVCMLVCKGVCMYNEKEARQAGVRGREGSRLGSTSRTVFVRHHQLLVRPLPSAAACPVTSLFFSPAWSPVHTGFSPHVW